MVVIDDFHMLVEFEYGYGGGGGGGVTTSRLSRSFIVNVSKQRMYSLLIFPNQNM